MKNADPETPVNIVHMGNIYAPSRAAVEIRPDMDQAVADFDELRLLSNLFGFDLAGAINGLAESGTPVWSCDVDWDAATTTGYAIAHYKLVERLQGVLTALRARNTASGAAMTEKEKGSNG